MTKINRISAESTIVTNFLKLFRLYLSDPLIPVRTNTNWIRSSEMVRKDMTPEGAEPLSNRKRTIVKESLKPDYPQVIVCDYNEKSARKSIKLVTGSYYQVDCELTIRIKDVGDVTRISNLAGQVSQILHKYYQSDIMPNGISNLDWDIVSTSGYADDDNEFNEKQVLLTFTARFNEWQL